MKLKGAVLITLSISFAFAVGDNVINSGFNTPVRSFLKNATEITIGGLFKLTRGSKTLSKGLQRTEAFKCAISKINADPNILPGVELLYNIQDDSGNSNTGLYKSMMFVQSEIPAIVGAGPSSVTEPVARLVSTFNIPLVSYASSSATLSDKSKYPTLLRTVASDVTQTKAMASLAKYLGWTLIAAAGTSDSYGSSGLNGFSETAENSGIKVVCSQIFPDQKSDGVEDRWSLFGDCIKASSAGAIMLFMNEENAANIISHLNKTKILTRDMTFIASDSWASNSLISYSSNQLSGAFSPDFIKGTIGTAQQPGDLNEFSKCFSDLNPNNNGYPIFNNFWENTFKCSLTNNSLPVCDDDISKRESSCICNGRERLDGQKPNSKVALVHDALYSVVNALHYIIFKCDLLKSKDFCSGDSYTSGDVYDAMQELSFKGLSGTINFDGNDRVESSFNYFQFDGESWKNIGFYDSAGSHLQNDALTWGTKDGGKPESAAFIDFVSYDHPVSIIVACMAGFNIIVACFFIFYFTVNAEQPVIKRSSPFFCNLILIGLIEIWISLYLWSGVQSVYTCTFKIWIGAIGFATVMGNMLAKTWRIWKIFDNARLRIRTIRNKELFYASSVIVGIEIILLSIWSSDTMYPQVDESITSNIYQYQSCKQSSSEFQKIMTAIILIYNGMLVLAGSTLAYLTRKVVSSFNESKFISMSMYNIFICLVVIVPIYYTTGDGPGYKIRLYIIRSLSTLFASTFTMYALFLPKLHQLHKAAEESSNSEPQIQGQPKFGKPGVLGVNRMQPSAILGKPLAYSPNLKASGSVKEKATSQKSQRVMKSSIANNIKPLREEPGIEENPVPNSTDLLAKK